MPLVTACAAARRSIGMAMGFAASNSGVAQFRWLSNHKHRQLHCLATQAVGVRQVCCDLTKEGAEPKWTVRKKRPHVLI